MHADDHKMTRLLKRALSHPTRQEILGHLMASAEPMSGGDLARLLDIGEAKVTYHLTVLRDAELVTQAESVHSTASPVDMMSPPWQPSKRATALRAQREIRG